MTSPIILGIESSCDDTSVAVICNNKILANVVSTQIIHSKYGGVVPELASRSHQKNIVSVINEALTKAKITQTNISAIAFTQGPGLMGSLLVGSSFAKSMSVALEVPLLPVNHMNAHILAHFIADNKSIPTFPFLCLTVSGGHTEIVLIKDYFDHEVIGRTLDDAAGEAFDKIGKMLGLSYPAGPQIDKISKEGNPNKFKFTKPKVGNFDFSFSGLKTAVLRFLEKQTKINPDFISQNLSDLCASVQHTIVSICIKQLLNVAKLYNIKDLAIAGGVSANSELRRRLLDLENNGYNIHIPKFEYTTDNAAMIAMTGQIMLEKEMFGAVTDVCYARNPK